MRIFKLVVLAVLILSSCQNDELEIQSIHQVLNNQVDSWNDGDIEQYMQGYWKSENLVFSGGKTMSKGWQETLNRYKKSYPNKESMGELTFENLEVQMLSEKSAFTIGEWRLERSQDTLNGRFTLIWRKLNGTWFIIADHSS